MRVQTVDRCGGASIFCGRLGNPPMGRALGRDLRGMGDDQNLQALRQSPQAQTNGGSSCPADARINLIKNQGRYGPNLSQGHFNRQQEAA